MRNETKLQAFQRISERRINQLKHSFKLIRNLSSHNYEYTKEDAEKLIATIEKELEILKTSMMERFNTVVGET